jgi:hypothetical protein
MVALAEVRHPEDHDDARVEGSQTEPGEVAVDGELGPVHATDEPLDA